MALQQQQQCLAVPWFALRVVQHASTSNPHASTSNPVSVMPSHHHLTLNMAPLFAAPRCTLPHPHNAPPPPTHTTDTFYYNRHHGHRGYRVRNFHNGYVYRTYRLYDYDHCNRRQYVCFDDDYYEVRAWLGRGGMQDCQLVHAQPAALCCVCQCSPSLSVQHAVRGCLHSPSSISHRTFHTQQLTHNRCFFCLPLVFSCHTPTPSPSSYPTLQPNPPPNTTNQCGCDGHYRYRHYRC